MMTAIYDIFANLTYALIDVIAVEVLLLSLFVVDGEGRIKLTIAKLSNGISPYKKTSYFVSIVLLVLIVYFFISNYIQDIMITQIANTGWKTIPTFILVTSIAIFWLTKITLGRKWKFPLVKESLISIIITALIIIFL